MKKYLSVIPLALLLCSVVGCQDQAMMAELEQSRAQAKNEEQNKELVCRAMAAWNKVDTETLKEIYAADYAWRFAGEGTLSLEDLIKDLKWEIQVYPDRIFSIEDIISKKDKVITRYVLQGTNEGDREGIPATRKKVEMEGIIINRIENGKIVESWDVADLLSLYKQLGMELKPKEAEK